MRNGCLAVLLAASAMLVTACGGGSDGDGDDDTKTTPKPTAEQSLRTAAQKLVDTRDGTLVCTKLITQRFVDDVFEGDQQKCSASFGEEPDPDAGKTTVVDAAVTGPQGTVEVRQVGGAADGIGGHVGFVREGTAWKADRYEDDYLRGVYAASIKIAGARGGDAALAYPPLAKCMGANAETMPAASVRRFVEASLRKDPKASDMVIKQAEKCPDALAGYVANAITNGLAKGEKRSDAYLRCMKRGIRGFLSLTELASTALKGNTNDATTAALIGIASGVDKGCRGK